MNQSSSQKQTTTQTDRPLWVELSDDELSNVSGGSGAGSLLPPGILPPNNNAGCEPGDEVTGME